MTWIARRGGGVRMRRASGKNLRTRAPPQRSSESENAKVRGWKAEPQRVTLATEISRDELTSHAVAQHTMIKSLRPAGSTA